MPTKHVPNSQTYLKLLGFTRPNHMFCTLHRGYSEASQSLVSEGRRTFLLCTLHSASLLKSIGSKLRSLTYSLRPSQYAQMIPACQSHALLCECWPAGLGRMDLESKNPERVKRKIGFGIRLCRKVMGARIQANKTLPLPAAYQRDPGQPKVQASSCNT
eukprot:1160430-Pelagomonas_calceolata.AAC.4